MISILGGPRHRTALKGVAVVGALCLLITLIVGLRHERPHADLRIPLRILPLGDSITWGWHPDSQDHGTDGYRAQLLRNLILGWYQSVDFVGTQHSGFMFDNDNEGHVNSTIGEIMGAMMAALQMQPNIVLVHVGTTDLDRSDSALWKDAPQQLGKLLDAILEACPDAVVLVAKIIQALNQRTGDNIRAFNEAVPEVVEEKAKKGFKIRVVDQSVVSVYELADGLHPSHAGYAHMGMVWFDAIKDVSGDGLITPPVFNQTL
ncbi:carbohydrate esterase family 3 protein [Bipolaris zeicola 26-R-13]|uniref:Carbohydrate esterase family 3 protein n=1 Tax=Cochliobolus carbonum (strain 26-R-13) TaxID=930089 RepID=W6YTD8_COCC2|nr:carbohydrate esterase family 3 protein [Bipolaris zeicola 26-R-13]EUC34776.1 carbohydrate esterase family 3 protein [Bipolaris zeicola 26-R-13]